MKPEILLVEPMLAEIEAALDHAYLVHRASTLDNIAQPSVIRAVVTGGATGVSRAVMDGLPGLGIIAINGIGTDAVDLAQARLCNIRVTTTPDVLTDDVADMAMGLILCASRSLCVADRFVRAGDWGRGSLALARKVSGARVGILGFGRVGQAIARRARSFDMKISYNDNKDLNLSDFRFVPDLLRLARDNDILVVAASGGPQSRHIVDRRVMDELGPQGLLVNVARGSIIDEEAMVAALQGGTLGGAALDVFAHEPHVPQALLGMDNVVLQPHRASATYQTRLAMGHLVVENLALFFEGAPLRTAVV